MIRLQGYACTRCARRYPADMVVDSRGCPECASQAPANLRAMAELRPTRNGLASPVDTRLPSLWRYADRLPCVADKAVSLGEGLTPLVGAARIGAEVGVPRLMIKDEGTNPTWSHKDRFSTLAVSAALDLGAEVVATSSSGNAGASLAAYAARAGLTCVVSTFAGAAAPMRRQIQKYGATVVPFQHKVDRWAFLADGVERFGWFATSPFRAPVVGSHPIGIAGYRTMAFEIVEQMQGAVPDWCVLPVCYGDALAGLWDGFRALAGEGLINRLPRLLAAEVFGSLAAGLCRQGDRVPDIARSFAPLAVSVGATCSTFQALQALRESQGSAIAIGNEGLVALQERLARLEGIFAELSSVMPFAAIAQARRDGLIGADDTVVAIVTASGLKDLDRSTDGSEGGPAFASVQRAWDALRGHEPFWAAGCGTAYQHSAKNLKTEGERTWTGVTF